MYLVQRVKVLQLKRYKPARQCGRLELIIKDGNLISAAKEKGVEGGWWVGGHRLAENTFPARHQDKLVGKLFGKVAGKRRPRNCNGCFQLKIVLII